MNIKEKPELLAPAGNLEKLKIAIEYGADAVYIGGEEFSLRVAADNFTNDEIKLGVDFAKARGKKVYLTANIIAKIVILDTSFTVLSVAYAVVTALPDIALSGPIISRISLTASFLLLSSIVTENSALLSL